MKTEAFRKEFEANPLGSLDKHLRSIFPALECTSAELLNTNSAGMPPL